VQTLLYIGFDEDDDTKDMFKELHNFLLVYGEEVNKLRKQEQLEEKRRRYHAKKARDEKEKGEAAQLDRKPHLHHSSSMHEAKELKAKLASKNEHKHHHRSTTLEKEKEHHHHRHKSSSKEENRSKGDSAIQKARESLGTTDSNKGDGAIKSGVGHARFKSAAMVVKRKNMFVKMMKSNVFSTEAQKLLSQPATPEEAAAIKKTSAGMGGDNKIMDAARSFKSGRSAADRQKSLSAFKAASAATMDEKRQFDGPRMDGPPSIASMQHVEDHHHHHHHHHGTEASHDEGTGSQHHHHHAHHKDAAAGN